MHWESGYLLHIHIAPIASADMVELNDAELVAGKGILMTDITMRMELIQKFLT